MKNYTITVNGNVYDVTVEENTNGAPAAAPAPRAAAPAPAPAAKPAAASAAGSISITAGAAGKVVDVVARSEERRVGKEWRMRGWHDR